MDYLTACYHSKMRPFRDRPDIEIAGRWHWCPPGARAIPYYHRFGSGQLDPSTQNLDGPTGEVKGRRGRTRGGANPRYTGQTWCGDETVWTQGALYSALGTPAVDAEGVPLCCNALPATPGGECAQGDAIVGGPEATELHSGGLTAALADSRGTTELVGGGVTSADSRGGTELHSGGLVQLDSRGTTELVGGGVTTSADSRGTTELVGGGVADTALGTTELVGGGIYERIGGTTELVGGGTDDAGDSRGSTELVGGGLVQLDSRGSTELVGGGTDDAEDERGSTELVGGGTDDAEDERGSTELVGGGLIPAPTPVTGGGFCAAATAISLGVTYSTSLSAGASSWFTITGVTPGQYHIRVVSVSATPMDADLQYGSCASPNTLALQSGVGCTAGTLPSPLTTLLLQLLAVFSASNVVFVVDAGPC